MKNGVSGLLMEIGVEYNKQRLHKVSYFRELLTTNEEVHSSIRPFLKLSRETIERCSKTEYALVSSLQRDPVLADRIKLLQTMPASGRGRVFIWQKPPRCSCLQHTENPSRHARVETHGRPRLSFHLLGSGNSGSANSHCASVNRMNRRLLTSQAHQTILFKQQYPA
jgi:hypothetical protein